MEVLLCDDVENLGHRGQVVRVRAGYGRNYLLPQGLAIEATSGNKRMIEEQRRILAKREHRERESAQGQAESLNGLELHFNRRVGEHGVLYGSVTALDLVEALKERGHKIERRKVSLREPIKAIGEYEVAIKLHREVAPIVKVLVHKEGVAEEVPPELAAQLDGDAPVIESPAAEDTAEANE
jgi:large subunit ribosomal protein L9